MKRIVRVELDPSADAEEIVIRCKAMTPELQALRALAESGGALRDSALPLTYGGAEYLVPPSEILFFCSDGDRTTAHTEDRMYSCGKKLYELPDLLPACFMRVSKSCVANLRRITFLKKDLTGVCEAGFGTPGGKRIFVSRMYYKAFRERLIEAQGIVR